MYRAIQIVKYCITFS